MGKDFDSSTPDEISLVMVGNNTNSPKLTTVEGVAFAELMQKKDFLRLNQADRDKLRENSTRILSKCLQLQHEGQNPTALVVGHVQSGKTSSFLSVMALARDNSFPIIFILTGTSNILFDQSFDRIKSAFSNASGERNDWLIVPCQDRDLLPQHIKSVVADWKSETNLQPRRRTVVIVVMKSHKQLSHINDALEDTGAESLNVMIIDDEADQASLNTREKKGGSSSTFSQIIRLRSKFPRHIFLQYTATPQAPLLLDITNSLSPGVVKLLTPGEGYTGGKEFFYSQEPSTIKEITDKELTIQKSRSKIPNSLQESMMLFYIVVACGELDTTKEIMPKICSMLVHPSEKTKVRDQYLKWVNIIKKDLHENLTSDDETVRNSIISDFEIVYETLPNRSKLKFRWEKIKEKLARSVKSTIVIKINSNEGKTPKIEFSNSDSWIIVAGQAVDRGFTVEGLTVTYMPRSAKKHTADNMQQRARFFGYKKSYFDFCRVYLKSGTINDFKSYVQHELHMRKVLKQCDDENLPMENWKREFLLEESMKPCRENILKKRIKRGKATSSWDTFNYHLKEEDDVESNRKTISDALMGLNFERDGAMGDLSLPPEATQCDDLSLADFFHKILVPWRPSEEESDKATIISLQIKMALENGADENVTIIKMDDKNKFRTLKGKRVEQIFSGSGKNNEGGRSLKIDDRITVHIYNFYLKGKDETEKNVPFLAIWIPGRLRLNVITQES